ncbi:TonB-dependent receptor [Polaribacter porphyrae]|uniref:Outer membrane protein beta-barrel domain-containing protein n=1 Tax=Polaribacter porphyrae TaxID=1137780 RepID=A0A2S7WL68_9FLAO|nr:outer membrane beta-barrel family protein [Polaribacter porphyrae]PQJ78176.1 hypothetical protein BTO18_02760 [Polaribacter porphyrae]
MRLFLCYFFLLGIINQTLSQKKSIFKGTVKDTITFESIPFTTIAVYNNATLIDGVSSDDKGNFRIKIDANFTHFEISFIGYKKQKLLISEIKNQDKIAIYLTPEKNQLEEIVINSELTTTQLKIDRKVVNLGADLQQSGTTALEAFDQISEIQTDLSTGAISLRGSGNVRLLIDGKPTALSVTELLDQMPASVIEKVEIITSPSAKNQANGLSGIINIILKKDKNLGLNLMLNSSVGTKRYNYGLNTNYNFAFVNLRLNASNGIRNMDSPQNVSQLFTNGNTRDFFTPRDFNGKTSNINFGSDFTIDDKNRLSFDITYNYSFHSFFNNTFNTNLTGRNDFIYSRNSSHTHKTTVYNANYKKDFTKEGHILEIDYNLNDNTNDYPAKDFEDGIFLFEEEENNKVIQQSFMLDYALPIKQNLLLETGLSWNNKDLNSKYEIKPNAGILSIANFSYLENLYGFYGLVKFKLGNLNWQTGLRYEYFTSKSNNTANQLNTDLEFSDLFPSVHLSYKINDANTFNVGYSRRVSRPSSRQVNPFRLGNQFTVWKANPNLKPEFSDNFEINYQYKKNNITWSLATFYRDRKDIILSLQDIDINGVRTYSYANFGKKYSSGIETDIIYKLTNFWTSQLSGNYYYSNINQNITLTWDTQFSSTYIFKNTFKISKYISSDISYRYLAKEQTEFTITEPRNRIDFAVRAKFLSNKLIANLRIVDLLDKNLRKSKTVLQDVTQNEVYRFQSQTFGWLLSLNYQLFEKKKS